MSPSTALPVPGDDSLDGLAAEIDRLLDDIMTVSLRDGIAVAVKSVQRPSPVASDKAQRAVTLKPAEGKAEPGKAAPAVGRPDAV